MKLQLTKLGVDKFAALGKVEANSDITENKQTLPKKNVSCYNLKQHKSWFQDEGFEHKSWFQDEGFEITTLKGTR